MKQVFTFLKANRYINKYEEHNMGLLKYKGYTGSVDYSEEDNCLYGKVLGMSKDMITYEGQDVNELRRDFEGAIDDYLALCKANGKLLQSQTHNITPEKV